MTTNQILNLMQGHFVDVIGINENGVVVMERWTDLQGAAQSQPKLIPTTWSRIEIMTWLGY